MLKFIPKSTKLKATVWKMYSVKDCIFVLLAFAITVVIVMSNIKGRWIMAVLFAVTSFFLLFPISEDKIVYESIGYFFRYLFSKKKYSGKDIDKLVPYKVIQNNGIIEYPDYYGAVMRIGSKEFGLQAELAQELDITRFADAIAQLELGKVMDLVKIDRPIIFDKFISDIDKQIAWLNIDTKINRIKKMVLEERHAVLDNMNTGEKVYTPSYYIVLYDDDLKEISKTVQDMASYLRTAGIEAELVESAKDVAVFLKYCNTRNFDEREIDSLEPKDYIAWIKPKSITFKTKKYITDDVEAFNLGIDDFPLTVDAAWGAELFNIDNTKVVMHIAPVDQYKAIKRVDKVCKEVLARQDQVHKASRALDQETHLESMKELLVSLQNSKDRFYDVSMVITGFDYEQKGNFRQRLINQIRTRTYGVEMLFARQLDGCVTSNISRHSATRYLDRGINGNSLASVFPFVYTCTLERGGVPLACNQYPVIWNMWKKDGTHRNANTMVFGRPGSGKSFFLKTMLTNAIADDTICFIIDPENEYNVLALNVGGTQIDVGTALKGNLNPFHIYQILTEDAEPAPPATVFKSHLQTLEAFFKVILDGCNSDVLEVINNAVVDVYTDKGIEEHTNVIDFKAEQFPIFDDLFYYLEKKSTQEKNKLQRDMYIKASSYIKKFASGGRYSELWGKPSSLESGNVLTVFNFQSLFSNKNSVVANAQMLLVFRFLEQQVINIREMNRNGDKVQHIMIVADEAHMFIDPKYPIALDFFYQMEKRIRKYEGTFIPATQNVADWNASEEVRSKTMAIIKCTQYTYVFALNPADVDDLCVLYKQNPLTDEEQQIIISANMGETFYLGAWNERATWRIVASGTVESIFSDKSFWENIDKDEQSEQIAEQLPIEEQAATA